MDFGDIKKTAHNFFKDILTQRDAADMSNIDSLLEHIPAIIFKDENWTLNCPVEEAKVFAAIGSLGPDKAPGPDGFPISFYRHYWALIKYDLPRMLHYSHKSFRVGGNINSSFLALVPKESNPSSFSGFRPISLCNSSYKILSKIISSQIKKLLPKIILQNQGAGKTDYKQHYACPRGHPLKLLFKGKKYGDQT